MVLKAVSSFLLIATVATAAWSQEGDSLEVSASARLQAQVEAATVAAPTKQPAIFFVAVYPKDATEHSLIQGNGVLMVSVFGRNEKETQVRSVRLEDANGITELRLSRTLKRNEVDTPAVIRRFGESRRNHFYILPPTATAGGALEVQLERGGMMREPLAQHSIGYQVSPPLSGERSVS